MKKRRKWGRKEAWRQGEKGSSSFLLSLLSLRFCIFSRRSHRNEVVEESEVNGSFLLALFLHTLTWSLYRALECSFVSFWLISLPLARFLPLFSSFPVIPLSRSFSLYQSHSSSIFLSTSYPIACNSSPDHTLCRILPILSLPFSRHALFPLLLNLSLALLNFHPLVPISPLYFSIGFSRSSILSSG